MLGSGGVESEFSVVLSKRVSAEWRSCDASCTERPSLESSESNGSACDVGLDNWRWWELGRTIRLMSRGVSHMVGGDILFSSILWAPGVATLTRGDPPFLE